MNLIGYLDYLLVFKNFISKNISKQRKKKLFMKKQQKWIKMVKKKLNAEKIEVNEMTWNSIWKR